MELSLDLQAGEANLRLEKDFLSQIRHQLNKGNVLFAGFVREYYDEPEAQEQIDFNLRQCEMVKAAVRYQETKVRRMEVGLAEQIRNHYSNN